MVARRPGGARYLGRMTNEREFERQQVLTLIEAAQRAGRSEDEIVEIVERSLAEDLGAEAA